MGPSLFSDGRILSRWQHLPRQRRFNGAVAVQRRKESRRVQEGRHTRASMGPSLFSDGRLLQSSDPGARCITLQWGRRCSATEGLLPTTRWQGRVTLLQWGRRCSATEGMAFRGPRPRLNWLQWGRRCSATEGVSEAFYGGAEAVGFNGAVAVQRRKVRQGHGPQSQDPSASMGPSLFSDGRLAGHTLDLPDML